MGLLDRILTANGDSSNQYAKGGRHLVRLTRAYLRDPSEDTSVQKMGGGFDGVIVNSTRTDDQHAKGNSIRVNDGFKYPESALARMRRGIASCATSKTGKAINEVSFGLTKNDGEDDKAFNLRIVAEVKRLFGSEQPCKGALVVFECTERQNQSGKKDDKGNPSTYTLFEVVVPTQEDLIAAGLIPAATQAQASA